MIAELRSRRQCHIATRTILPIEDGPNLFSQGTVLHGSYEDALKSLSIFQQRTNALERIYLTCGLNIFCIAASPHRIPLLNLLVFCLHPVFGAQMTVLDVSLTLIGFRALFSRTSLIFVDSFYAHTVKGRLFGSQFMGWYKEIVLQN